MIAILDWFKNLKPLGLQETSVKYWGRYYGDDLARIIGETILERLSRMEIRLYLMERHIMADLDQVIADVQDEATVIAGIKPLLDGIRQQLADALAGTTIPPAV